MTYLFFLDISNFVSSGDALTFFNLPGYSNLSGWMKLQKPGIALFQKVKFANKPWAFDALNLSNIVNKKPIQRKSLYTLNTRSHLIFPIAIPDTLNIPQPSITRHVNSIYTSNIFPRFPHLVLAQTQSFYTSHMVI